VVREQRRDVVRAVRVELLEHRGDDGVHLLAPRPELRAVGYLVRQRVHEDEALVVGARGGVARG